MESRKGVAANLCSLLPEEKMYHSFLTRDSVEDNEAHRQLYYPQWVEARDTAEPAEQPPLPRIIQRACCWSPAVDQRGFLLAAFLSCLW